MGTADRPVVLLVDDNEDQLAISRLHFQLSGYQVEEANSVEAGFEKVDTGREISIALIDYHLDHGLDASLLFDRIKSRAYHRMRGYAYTADHSIATYSEAVHSGAFRVFHKTVHPLSLIMKLMLEDYFLIRGNAKDDKSGLYNFHGFRDAVTTALAAARERPDEHHPTVFSMLFFDVDRFKNINDTYGHEVGDKVIRWLGQMIKKHTRRDDYDCRVGGDEYALCLPGVDAHLALVRAMELQNAIAETPMPLNGSDKGLQINVSVGVGTMLREEIEEDASVSFDKLLALADGRMYVDKDSHELRQERRRSRAV